jgi:DNA-binding XRE family transcriptional regulator
MRDCLSGNRTAVTQKRTVKTLSFLLLINFFYFLIVSSWKICTFAGNCQDVKIRFMMFTEKIRHLREECQIPQRKLAAALDIDTATYCKYEKGGRRPRREQVVILADLLETDREELLTLWLADQVYSVVKDEKHAGKALTIVAKKL